MSNIILNGNTYNDVTSVKLLKSDNTGYAEFTEDSAVTDTTLDKMLAGESLGDITDSSAYPNLTWMVGLDFGTVSFPSATKAYLRIQYCEFANLLLPSVVNAYTASNGTQGYMMPSKISGVKVTGICDLHSLTTVQNRTLNFEYCNFGTLKLGDGNFNDTMFNNTTITNLVWNISSATLDDTGVKGRLNYATAITNLYVPSDRVSAIQALVTGDNITKVTNVYSIADWSDPT